MLTIKQIKMLKLLDKQVMNCNLCELKSNGTAKPYWTPDSKYAIIGEIPGVNEVRQQIPFLGAAGKILTDELSKVNFESKDFLIINTVQCRPNDSKKPNEDQIIKCQVYLRKYLKVIKPEKILCLGNYAKYIFTNNFYGVLAQRGVFFDGELDGGVKIPALITVHPAYCIYNSDEGLPMLRNDIKLFKETNFVDWMFTEDDFRL
jgi:DNA polymerase